MDVHLRLDDGNEPCVENLQPDIELLVHNGGNASIVVVFDDRAHLRAEDTLIASSREERVEFRHRLHYLRAVLLVGKPLVYLDDRNDVLGIPQVLGGPDTVDVAIHRAFEQDRREHPISVKRGVLDDAGAHLVHEIEHLVVAGVLALLDSIELEGLGRATAALVESCDKSLGRAELFRHLLVH